MDLQDPKVVQVPQGLKEILAPQELPDLKVVQDLKALKVIQGHKDLQETPDPPDPLDQPVQQALMVTRAPRAQSELQGHKVHKV